LHFGGGSLKIGVMRITTEAGRAERPARASRFAHDQREGQAAHGAREIRFFLASLLAALLVFPATLASSPQEAGRITGFASGRVAPERQLEWKYRKIPRAGRAESDLRSLTSEPHMAGTEASRRVAEWLRDQLIGFGFDTEIVTYNVWLPQLREAKLELTKPENKLLGSPEQPVGVDKDTYDKRVIGGFNVYSPSGEVTAPVVYVNYGAPEDYRELASLGIHVAGKIVLARYGRDYRGIKAKVADEHKAAALILYSDPQDDGATVGETYPRGPWRPMSGIQRGSIVYTQIYPGDPLTPGVAATLGAKRLAPADAQDLPSIPTMSINAQDAKVLLANLGGQKVPARWQGGLPFSYRLGPGPAEVHLKLEMDYEQRPLYDVIAKLHGTSDKEWVMLGNHHDAWVFGAADPGSGTAAVLETARALGELARSGWKPRRTIVICEWDGEEPGLLGSTEWVEENRAELQAKAVVYINTDVGVTGPNFTAAASPSLKEFVRDSTRDVDDPATGHSLYDAWLEHSRHASEDVSGIARPSAEMDTTGKPPVSPLGSGSDYSAFLDYAGIPSIDVAFAGNYGVYHSMYDDFYWMKHFGDPTFDYHVALARIMGTMVLRFDEADILPFDYPVYASEIEHRFTDRFQSAREADQDILEPALEAAGQLSASALNASDALQAISGEPLDPARTDAINHLLVSVEQALLAPEGLTSRPWFKHLIYAPGSYAGYAAEVLPGITESLERNDSAALRSEASALTAALLRASARLDSVTRLAQGTMHSTAGQN
jgi:N-acetylated-alpha-linked acidic dipeptidase